MSELFSIPQTLSPRLKWLKKHAVHTHFDEGVTPGEECEVSGERLYPWCALTGEVQTNIADAIFAEEGRVGYGDTEDDAIYDLATKRGWRLWNEE